MAIKALVANETWWFIPDIEKMKIERVRKQLGDQEAENYKQNKALQICLRVISATEAETLENLEQPLINSAGMVQTPTMGSAIKYACYVGIVNWKNHAIEFKGRKLNGENVGATDADIASLPGEIKRNVYEELSRKMKVAELDFC